LVAISVGNLGWDQLPQIDLGVGDGLTASVQSANGGAPVEGGVGVIHAVVAFFAENCLQDAVTAEWKAALVGATGVSCACGVAFFVGIGHTVAAKVSAAVGSASVGEGVAVGSSVIAVFAVLSDTVSAVGPAAGTAVLVDLVSVVALLSVVHDTITASCEAAVGSAGIWDGVVVGEPVVALLASEGIHNSVSAGEQSAVQTASIGAGVAVSVQGSLGRMAVVALFSSNGTVGGVDDSVTAAEGAVGEAVQAFSSIVALFV